MKETDPFYVIAHEPGAENPAIPTWANRNENPLQLSSNNTRNPKRIDLEAVPGAFQVMDVLSANECQQLIELTEALGYLQDAAVSLPRSVRHNHSLTWVVDQITSDTIWHRCQEEINRNNEIFFGKQALGLNNRFRFYRYQSGDYFAPHTDGAWPGSQIVNGELVHNAFDDRWSQLTFLIFLNDDFTGGETQFLMPMPERHDLTRRINNYAEKYDKFKVRISRGGVLCFPHGNHPLHCLHSSEKIAKGVKYIIRSDVLFEL